MKHPFASIKPGAGSKHHKSKLDEFDVKSMRAFYATGEVSHQELADRYCISVAHIGKILRRERWQHI